MCVFICLVIYLSQVAASLHNTLIGGKKRSFYHDDMWNLRYLKGFKWDHLTEKFAYERRVREAKLRAAMIEVRYVLFIAFSIIIVMYVHIYLTYLYVYMYIGSQTERGVRVSGGTEQGAGAHPRPHREQEEKGGGG